MHYQAASLTQVIEGGDVSFVHSDTRAGSTRREPHAPKSPTAEARTPADMAGHNIPLTAAIRAYPRVAHLAPASYRRV